MVSCLTAQSYSVIEIVGLMVFPLLVTVSRDLCYAMRANETSDTYECVSCCETACRDTQLAMTAGILIANVLQEQNILVREKIVESF